jgi:hypothetical protein
MNLSEIQLDTTTKMYTMDELSAETEYELRVAARSQRGRGVWSSTVTMKTKASGMLWS